MAKQKVIWNHDLLKLIRDARSTKNSTRIVLNALAIRADPRKRHSCFPRQPLIVIDTQLDLKTVRSALDRLEADGLIARKKRFDNTDMYWINVALLQHQAAANKAMKDELPECPFDEPTIEQEQQLDADEAKITFDEAPDGDSAPTEEPATIEPSPISAAIQSLKYVGEKLTVKDADRMATSLMKSHEEEDVLQAIASLDDYALRESYKAKNPIGYLRKSINNALADLKNTELATDDSRASDALVDATEDENADEPVPYEEMECANEPEPDSGLDTLPETNLDIIVNPKVSRAELRTILDSVPEGECRLLCSPDDVLIMQTRQVLGEVIYAAGLNDEYVIEYSGLIRDGGKYKFRVSRVICAQKASHA